MSLTRRGKGPGERDLVPQSASDGGAPWRGDPVRVESTGGFRERDSCQQAPSENPFLFPCFPIFHLFVSLLGSQTVV